MDIKNLLEQFKSDEVSVGKVIEQINDSKKDMVPRTRLNDKNAEIEELKNEIANRDNQISELSQSAEKDSELEKKLEELTKNNTEWEGKFKQAQIDNAIKLAVAKDANDANDILNFINRDSLQFSEDGTINGLDEAINQVKESKPYLFQPVKPTGKRPVDADKPVGVTQDQFNKMSYSERVNLLNTQPEVYNQLAK